MKPLLPSEITNEITLEQGVLLLSELSAVCRKKVSDK